MSLVEHRAATTEGLLQIEGAFNLRDVGGHPVSSTGSTRYATIYRSGHLGFLTSTGKSALQDLGIGLRIDLRNCSEASFVEAWAKESMPPLLIPTSDATWLPEIIHLPFDAQEDDALLDRFRKYDSKNDSTPQDIASRYTQLISSSSAITTMRKLTQCLLQHTRGAIMIHCSLGKDRTGIVIALLLALAGVLDEQIAEDYALSGPELTKMLPQCMKFASKHCPDEEQHILEATVVQMITANRLTMILFLQNVRREFGGVWEYFNAYCGIDGSCLEAVQLRLIQPLHTV